MSAGCPACMVGTGTCICPTSCGAGSSCNGELTGVDARLAKAAEGLYAIPATGPTLADAREEFGETHEIYADEFCCVAIRRPTPRSEEVTTGRTPAELVAKLRKDRDGRG